MYEELPGWGHDLSAITAYDELPAQARGYLEFIEEQVGVPVALVGIGQRRDQTIMMREVLAAA